MEQTPFHKLNFLQCYKQLEQNILFRFLPVAKIYKHSSYHNTILLKTFSKINELFTSTENFFKIRKSFH